MTTTTNYAKIIRLEYVGPTPGLQRARRERERERSSGIRSHDQVEREKASNMSNISSFIPPLETRSSKVRLFFHYIDKRETIDVERENQDFQSVTKTSTERKSRERCRLITGHDQVSQSVTTTSRGRERVTNDVALSPVMTTSSSRG